MTVELPFEKLQAMLRNTPGEYSSDNGEKSQKSDGDTMFSKK